MRIGLVLERLAPPFDEGFKNVALHLVEELSARHEVLALNCFGDDLPDYAITGVRTNRLLLSVPLWSALGRFRPDLVCYLPTASTTPSSFLRARMLRLLSGHTQVALLALQPRHPGRIASVVIPWLQPDLMLTTSPDVLQSLPRLRCPTALIPLGVDAGRFAPCLPEHKAELRARYGIPPDAWVLLHVGHIKRERNVQALAQIRRETEVQALLVGSTSTAQEADLAAELRAAGVMIITEYLDIADAYHMADGYLFPVAKDIAAIGIPLSVLEAMACNLPVVTTPFGGLPGLFASQPERGLWFAGEKELASCVAEMQARRTCATREMVAPYTWGAVAEAILRATTAVLGELA